MAVNISENLKKPYWVRKVLNGAKRQSATRTYGQYTTPTDYDSATMQLLTEEDFLNEINAGTHDINSDIFSKRPIFDVETYTAKNGKEKRRWRLKGYDNAEVVALSLQRRFAFAKASYFAAKGFSTANETTDHEAYGTYKSWMDVAGIGTAYLEAILSCFQTGDAAIYVYQHNNTLEYKVFSYLYGDRLFPQLDENREPVIYRQYTLNGKNAVDVYSTKRIQTWVQVDPNEESDRYWVEKVKNWFGRKPINLQGEISEDGYKCIYDNETQVGKGFNQCIYFSVPDIPSGCVESSIEALERSLSYVAEEVKSSAFPILFLKALKMDNLPPIGAHGKTIGVKGNADDLKASDAKYLTKQDMSNIATVNIKSLTENIMHGSLSVFIDPEILKQGSDSSTTIKIMFAPEIQFCQTMWPYVRHQVKALAYVFKELVGKIEGEVERYGKLRISVWQEIWIPENDSEIIDQTCKMVYAGILSQKNAASEIGLTYIGDSEKIKKEAEEKLYRENYIPTMAKAKAEAEYGTQPNEKIVVEKEKNTDVDNGKPKLDKNLQRRDLAEEV